MKELKLTIRINEKKGLIILAKVNNLEMNPIDQSIWLAGIFQYLANKELDKITNKISINV